MRTKLNLVTLLLCAGIISHAQNLNPVEIPCTKVIPANMNNFNGLLDANCIIDENNDVSSGNTININGIQNVELKAGEEINLDGEVWVHPNPNGNFYAHIEPSEIGLAWYEPVATPGEVEKFEKLEIGIDLPDDINQYIQNYVTNSGIIRLNPFNPEKVDVKAEFWRNTQPNGNGAWNGPLKVYGFYYEEFFENTSDASSLNWTIDPLTTEHKFRVRFAPPQQGLWRCKITVTINMGTPQETVYEASEFTFKTVNSGNPGYVKIGSNNHFLTLGGQPFFPSGRNIPEPDYSAGSTNYQLFNIAQVDAAQNFDERKLNPAYYKSMRQELTDFRVAGGEDFRYLFFAEWHEIEFEKLNNYNDRLNSAWEFDRLIEHCEEIKVRMLFNFQNHEAFQWIGDFTRMWDWPKYNQVNNPECYSWNTNDVGYCYNTELGIATPEEFLTDEEAKKYYKYRLRYITSRWGYSTAISFTELRSEMNNHAKYIDYTYNPSDSSCNRTVNRFEYYLNQNNFLKNVSHWTDEMAEYLKTHQYYPHLLSVDYTGCPRIMYDENFINFNGSSEFSPISAGDSSYYSPYVDIAAYNHYDDKMDRFESMAKNIADLNYPSNIFLNNATNDNIVQEEINKPVMICETGLDYGICDQGVEYARFVWCSSFTGTAGTGLEWHHQHDYSLIQHNVNLKSFIGSLNFDVSQGGVWTPDFSFRDDLKAGLYCLRSNENKQRAIGVIENRTVNYWTINNPGSPCHTINNRPGRYYGDTTSDAATAIYDTPSVVHEENQENRLFIHNLSPLKKYKIDFYNAMTGQWIGSDTRTANFDGNVRVVYPDLSGDPSQFLIAFKLRRKNEPLFSQPYDTIYQHDLVEELMNDDSLPEIPLTTWNIEDDSFDFSINPNPTSGLININCSIVGDYHLLITDSKGDILLDKILSCKDSSVDISTLKTGIYYLTFTQEHKKISKKVIKI